MRLPNKIYTFNESVISDMIKILSAIDKPMSIIDLYRKVKYKNLDINRYIEAIDCLYITQKITYDARMEMIYVN